MSFVPATGSFSVQGDAASPCFSARLISFGSSGLNAWSSAERLVRIFIVSGKVDDDFPDYFCFVGLVCLFSPFLLLYSHWDFLVFLSVLCSSIQVTFSENSP